jgi:serine/threonine protein kinase
MTDNYVPTVPPDESRELLSSLDDQTKDLVSLIVNRFDGKFDLLGWREGGFGIVLFLRDKTTQFDYAVKTFKPKYQALSTNSESFKHEIEFWTDLDPHPNIITAYFLEIIDEKLFLFMERVDGPMPSLRDRLQLSRIDSSTAISFACQLCQAMEYANRTAEIAHRDLKPENILITTQDILKVTDFGLAYSVQVSNEFYERQRLGSWPYAPPERFLGVAENSCSDIYTFGVILYEMLAAELPYPFELSSSSVYEQLRDFHLKEGMREVCRKLYYGESVKIHGDLCKELIYNKRSIEVDPNDIVARLLACCLDPIPTQRFNSFRHLRATLEFLFGHQFFSKANLEAELSTGTRRVRTLGQIGNQTQALAELDRLLLRTPNDASLWLEAARIYLNADEPKMALSFVQQSLKIDPSSDEAKTLLLQLYLFENYSLQS